MKDVYLDTSVILGLYEDRSRKDNAEKFVLLAKKEQIRLAISEWVINECVGAVQRKRNENKLTKEEAAEILAGLADLVEGKVKEVNLLLYPVTANVVRNSLATIQAVACQNAGDAIHVYTAYKTGCHYFVTGDEELANKIKSSNLRHRLVAVDVDRLSDMLNFFSQYE